MQVTNLVREHLKCVSSSKRASMSKSERLSASRRKKKADPGQQGKSGAAKPTYVSTDKKKKMNEDVKRDEYGDPIGGPKISKKQLKKILHQIHLMSNIQLQQVKGILIYHYK